MFTRLIIITALLAIVFSAFAQDSMNVQRVYSSRYTVGAMDIYSMAYFNHTIYISTDSISVPPRISVFDWTNHNAPLRLRSTVYRPSGNFDIYSIHVDSSELVCTQDYNGNGMVFAMVSRDSFRLRRVTTAYPQLNGLVSEMIRVGQYYYVFKGNQLMVVDMSDSTNLNVVYTDSTPNHAHQCELYGHILIASDKWSVRIFNVANPAHPISLGRLPTYGFYPGETYYENNGISISGNRLAVFDTSSIRIYSLRPDSMPIFERSIPIHSHNATLYAKLAGNYVIISSDTCSIGIWRIAPGLQNQHVGYYRYGLQYGRIAVEGNYIFVRAWNSIAVYDFSQATGAIEFSNNNLPTSVHLSLPYPNPFNSTTTIRYALPFPTFARIDVYDALGRHVETLQNGTVNTGEQLIQWNAGGKPSGTYFIRLNANNSQSERTVILTK